MADRTPLRGRGHYKAWRAIATRWMDNDVYGHVNNVVYYSFFDTAVNAWLVEKGLLDIEKGPVIGLVVETGCTYARPVAFPEEVQARIRAEADRVLWPIITGAAQPAGGAEEPKPKDEHAGHGAVARQLQAPQRQRGGDAAEGGERECEPRGRTDARSGGECAGGGR